MADKRVGGLKEKYLAEYEPLVVGRKEESGVTPDIEFIQREMGSLFRVPYSETIRKKDYFTFSQFLSRSIE
jgi:hypothetical protein